MRIQGNCASPHSVCSEANAFLSYCLCRRLAVGTPIISSLGERPRCSQSGCGRPQSSQGVRQPAGSTLESPLGKARRAWAPCRGVTPLARDATLWGGKGRRAAFLGGREASAVDGDFSPSRRGVNANPRQAGQPALTTPAHQQHRVSTLWNEPTKPGAAVAKAQLGPCLQGPLSLGVAGWGG